MGTQPKKICIEQRRACRRLRLRKRYCEFVESLGIGSVPGRAAGAWFLVDRSDYIANDIAFWGCWEPERVNHLAEISRRHAFDHLIDVGANVGFYAVTFAAHRLVPKVIAFEPLPKNYRSLCRNLGWNRLL